MEAEAKRFAEIKIALTDRNWANAGRNKSLECCYSTAANVLRKPGDS